MDVHMKSHTKHFGTNGATSHNPGGDELKVLSQDVQETLNFFEQTIDSLEKSLNEEELRPQVRSFNNPVDTDGESHSHVVAKEQDIIDLVRSKPDLLQTRDTSFTPSSPDFQSLIQPPESHFEVKPRSDPADPSPLTEFGSSLTDSHPVYHPPGSIPTPALIAQKIAENQGGGSTVLSASSLLRRRSSEFDKSTSSNKQGPPTSTKPARYPANISVIHGNREQQNSSLANINIEERKAQMIANLSGTSNILLQDNLQQDETRNTPTRSVSFRDPTPEKSRLEALSKLGLSRNRAGSGGVSLPTTELLVGGEGNTNVPEPSTCRIFEPQFPPNILINTPEKPSPSVVTQTYVQQQSPPPSNKQQEHGSLVVESTNTKLPETSPSSKFPPNILINTPEKPSPSVVTQTYVQQQSPPPSNKQQEHGSLVVESTNTKLPETSPSSRLTYRTPDFPDAPKSFETKNPQPPDNDSFPPPPPPLDISAEFNSYGGKSIVVMPSASFKSDLPPSPVSSDPGSLSPVLANPSEFNIYGGKSKVMTPIPVPVARDLPDILSSHINKSQTLPSKNTSTESNVYRGRTQIINPSAGTGRTSEGSSRTIKPPAPTPAPRPPRHSYHGNTAPLKSPQRALSPEHKRRTGSLFRPQGITVQFSGKGGAEESRREALRKLGLLKD